MTKNSELKMLAEKEARRLMATDDYIYIGIRFEDAAREIGDECNLSRHNADRDDLRDFPEFGDQEYNNLEELDGSSAWQIWDEVDDDILDGWERCFTSFDDKLRILADHCYLIAGDDTANHDDPDDGEIVIKDARVISILF